MRDTAEFLSAIVLVSLAFGVFGLVQEYRRERDMHRATMPYWAAYVAFVLLGIGILVWCLDGRSPDRFAYGLAILMYAWIFFGAVWTARTIGRKEIAEMPAWLMRVPGLADAGIATWSCWVLPSC